jgi:hypothetical protein
MTNNEINQTALQEFWDKISLKLSFEQIDEFVPLFYQAKEMEKEQIGYTKADVIKAGEIGEINYLDTLHIVTYLDEAKQFNKTYGGNK